MRINSRIQQEEVHALIAINLAITLTDLALGTLQDATRRFSAGSDIGLARVFASITVQKGKQAGWYRMQQGKIPSKKPFPTTSDLSFAFSFVQAFTVRNSCPTVRSIRLKTYHPLTILTPPASKTPSILVGWKPNPAIKEPEMLWMTYINQLNLPVVVSLLVVALNEMAGYCKGELSVYGELDERAYHGGCCGG